MDDAARRIENMIAAQTGQQDQKDVAQAQWLSLIPELAKYAKTIVAPFNKEPVPNVFVESSLGRIVVYFSARMLRMVKNATSARAEFEKGAESYFACLQDGIVYGFRRAARPDGTNPPLDLFATLGDPSRLELERFGQAIADFLEWGAFGAGCGSAPLRLE